MADARLAVKASHYQCGPIARSTEQFLRGMGETDFVFWSLESHYVILDKQMIDFSHLAIASLRSVGIPAKYVSGYIETYFSYDLGNPDNHNRPGFVYSHNRHNEVNLNLGFIKAAYQKNNVRGNLALMTGTYANANLAAESATLKNIYKAISMYLEQQQRYIYENVPQLNKFQK